MSQYTTGQSWGALRKCWENYPESKWVWLAALVDGEGCLTVNVAKENRAGFPNRATLTITNTNHEIVSTAREAIGSGWISRKAPTKTGKPVYVYFCGSTTLRWLLPKLAPYLIVKRRLVPLLLEFLELMRERMGALRTPVSERQKFRYSKVLEIKQEVRVLNR